MPVQIRQEEGKRVAVKRATGAAAVAALHREARMLAMARHPGVVELVELRTLGGEIDDGSTDPGEPAEAELVTHHVGHHSLATFALRDLRHAAAIVAACAETVADLHSVSIVHRRLEPSHVLIDGQGRPVLTGFAGAALVGEPLGSPGDGRDGVDGPAGPARPAHDVADLGRLLTHIAAGPPETDPIPDRRFTKRTRTATYQRRALLNLADQATAETATARPSARSLAAAIRSIVPDATLTAGPPVTTGAERPRLTAPVATAGASPAAGDRPTPAAPPRPRPRPPIVADAAPRRSRRPSRGLPVAAGLCGVVAIGFGVASVNHGDRPTLADEVAPTTTASTAGTPPIALGGPPSPDAGCALVAPARPPFAPAGSCARSTAAVDGVITREGHRFAVGAPGDEVLVGDWTCDGEPRPAVIRPSTGDVYVFDRWAVAGADQVAKPVQRAEPGSHLETGAGSSPCPTLLVRGSDRPARPVTVARRSS